MRQTGILVAMLVVIATLASLISISGASASQARQSRSCAVGFNSGAGLASHVIFGGRPAWVVQMYCSGMRAKFHGGFQPTATKLVCFGNLRRYPGVHAGLWASPRARWVARAYCKSIFSRSYWHLYYK